MVWFELHSRWECHPRNQLSRRDSITSTSSGRRSRTISVDDDYMSGKRNSVVSVDEELGGTQHMNDPLVNRHNTMQSRVKLYNKTTNTNVGSEITSPSEHQKRVIINDVTDDTKHKDSSIELQAQRTTDTLRVFPIAATLSTRSR